MIRFLKKHETFTAVLAALIAFSVMMGGLYAIAAMPARTGGSILYKSDGTEVSYFTSVAHDADASTANPLLIGCYSNSAAPTDVSANTEATRLWCLRSGALGIQPTFAGILASTGNGVVGTGVQRVAIASDNTAFSVNIGTFPDNEPFNVAQINGVTPLMGSGNTGTGSLRVTLATDQPQLTNKLLVTPDSVALPANQSVNVNQVGGAGVVADPCEREATSVAIIDQTSGEQLVTGTASERIYVCGLNLVSATAQNVALVSGTGSVCATSTGPMLGGTTAATGYNLGANGGIVLPVTGKKYTFTDTDADNVCLLQSGGGQISGSLIYVSAASGL